MRRKYEITITTTLVFAQRGGTGGQEKKEMGRNGEYETTGKDGKRKEDVKIIGNK